MANTCTSEEKSAWVKRARLDSLLGSCPKSHQSFHSGAKLWAAYADKVLGLRDREFPPPLGGLLAWAGLLRHPKTFSNYLGYVRLGCHVLDVSDAVFFRPELTRAKLAVKKTGAFKPRQRMFLCHEQIRRIVAMADKKSPVEWPLAMLFLAAYVFMLRLPSEGLPMTGGGIGCGHGLHSVVLLEGDEVCLRLASRKNLPSGSVIRRVCWCRSCPATCPVHTLWHYFKELGVGAQPFAGFSKGFALKSLRNFLHRLAIPNPAMYRTHDFRRGHAQDLVENGASLGVILRAGQWKSPAFLEYLDLEVLEKGAVMEAHLDESSSDDEE